MRSTTSAKLEEEFTFSTAMGFLLHLLQMFDLNKFRIPEVISGTAKPKHTVQKFPLPPPQTSWRLWAVSRSCTSFYAAISGLSPALLQGFSRRPYQNAEQESPVADFWIQAGAGIRLYFRFDF
jgi:hypothetical protein